MSIDLTPAQAEELYGYCKKHSLTQFKERYCVDVSKYKGKVLVKFYVSIYRGGDWRENILIDSDLWQAIPEDYEMHLGEVNGKHSDVYRAHRDCVKEQVSDPYKIQDFVKHNQVCTDGGTLACGLAECLLDKRYYSSGQEDPDMLKELQKLFTTKKVLRQSPYGNYQVDEVCLLEKPSGFRRI